MRRSNFALRLQPSLLEELRKAAELEGVALNQLINVAVAEKVSALRTEDYFRGRAAAPDRPRLCGFLTGPAEGISQPKGMSFLRIRVRHQNQGIHLAIERKHRSRAEREK